MKDLSRRVRKLRRKVYRRLPVATRNGIAELDHRMSFAEMMGAFAQGHLGALSEGAALALWRGCDESNLRAWCYEFGFPQSLTHTVTVVEIDGVLQVHDAFFNLSYPLGLDDLLASLQGGNSVNSKREARDRKIYIADPAGETQQTLRWLEANADRELKPVAGLRRFELLWNPEAFSATYPAIDSVSRDLAVRGYPGDLQFLMLHPVSVFDGDNQHRDRSSMPLVGGRDLRSPVAELRVATRNLEAAQAGSAEKTVTIARLGAELAEANSQTAQLTADRDEAALAVEGLSRQRAELQAELNETSKRVSVEREAWLQQKVALQAGNSALEGELAETRARLTVANDLRAQRDSQIAQLRAEIEDSRREIEELRKRGTVLESDAGAALQHAIEITHYIAPLIEELNQMRQSASVEREAAARDRATLDTEIGELKARIAEATAQAAALEAKIAASPGARLTALWRRLATRWALPFRSDRARSDAEGAPPKGFESLSDSKVPVPRGPGNAAP